MDLYRTGASRSVQAEPTHTSTDSSTQHQRGRITIPCHKSIGSGGLRPTLRTGILQPYMFPPSSLDPVLSCKVWLTAGAHALPKSMLALRSVKEVDAHLTEVGKNNRN
ncbi:hypothetical protein E1301_Tti023445 [Triplophysa tibetana]|uniref:Uncharacterized protein n=1 Tax=Triplophysa tibetana TaxID=1572043 RepID=A0A5A9PD18_9TELE|nr:hypothetical protein E1301_Tti023445 [Triplophysa tibetana]